VLRRSENGIAPSLASPATPFNAPPTAAAATTPSANNSEFLARQLYCSPCSPSVESPLLPLASHEQAERFSVVQGGRIRLHGSRGPAAMQQSKVDRVRMEIGDFLLEELKNLEGGKPRRPILSIVADEGWVTKPVLERATGIKIGDKEMRKIKLHSRYPGKMKPALEAEVFRRRIPGSTLTALMHSLESGGKLQRNAFGTKLIEILGGHGNVTIENIERSQKVSRLAASFVIELFDEASEIEKGNLVVPADRCIKLERDSYRRCLHVSGHGGNCMFTPKGSISMTKASELIKLLTGEDVKKLSGLDDVKVEQGRENFAAMREYIDQLFGVDDPEEAMALQKRVTAVEDFHRTDFDMHLSPQSEYSCSCLTCGFFDNGKFRRTFALCNRINLTLFYSNLNYFQITQMILFARWSIKSHANIVWRAIPSSNSAEGSATKRRLRRKAHWQSKRLKSFCIKLMSQSSTWMSIEVIWLASKQKLSSMERKWSRCLMIRQKLSAIGR
jgi:hypothetical protein